jgi:hypothetical protein
LANSFMKGVSRSVLFRPRVPPLCKDVGFSN